MRKSVKPPTRTKTKPLLWFLGICFAITTGLVIMRIYYPPQSADIFLVGEPQLTYGDTVVSGILREGSESYVLELPSNQVIELDVEGIDNLLYQTITVYGYLSVDEYGNNIMQVSQIEVGAQ